MWLCLNNDSSRLDYTVSTTDVLKITPLKKTWYLSWKHDSGEKFWDIPGSPFPVCNPNVHYTIYKGMDNYIYSYFVRKGVKTNSFNSSWIVRFVCLRVSFTFLKWWLSHFGMKLYNCTKCQRIPLTRDHISNFRSLKQHDGHLALEAVTQVIRCLWVKGEYFVLH